MPPLSVEGSGSVPAAFGPFRVLHQLGAGALGPVFRAHDPLEGRLVAVKSFRLDLTPETAFAVVRQLEALVARNLSHPSLVAPIAAGLEGATPWLAQAYVPAESLDAALRQFGPAPTVHAVTIVTHLAGALDFAAAGGALHGSLHPRDILVAPDAASLVDIGVAQALERCGLRTPVRRPYSAPERIAGEPVSQAADLFALAAVAHELLLGQPITATDEAAAEHLPDIPGADLPELRRLFAMALAVDPGRRPDSALAFASAFKAALGSAAFRSTPAVAPRRTRRTAAAPALPLEPAAEPSRTIAGPPPDAEPPVLPAPAPTPVAAPQATAAAADPPFAEGPPPPEDDLRLREPLSAPRPRAVPVGAPEAKRRSMPVAALAMLILLGVVTGFGLGWLWVGGDSTATTDTSATTPTTGIDAPERLPATDEDTAVDLGGEGGDTAGDAGDPPESIDPPADAGAANSRSSDRASTLPSAPPPATPAPAPVRGRLTVRSTPTGALVEINGRERGRTPLSVGDLSLGGHTVVVARPGYRTERRRVTLSRSRDAQTLSVPLRRAESGRSAGTSPAGAHAFVGAMLVDSRPSGARVFIDGREVGRTPVLLSEIRAGAHVVRLELDGYRTWTTSARVVAGERGRVAASLEELTR